MITSIPNKSFLFPDPFPDFIKRKKKQISTAQPTYASAAKRQAWQSLKKKKDLQFF